jgi:LmbE family N-acetylglucosaminyl deacetylase
MRIFVEKSRKYLKAKIKPKELVIFLVLSVFVVVLFFAILLSNAGKHSRFAGEDIVSIVLSPHSDDGVISLGGLMAEKRSLFYVATFFVGSPKKDLHTRWDDISGFSGSKEAVEKRVEENKEAIGILGGRSINFNFLDYQYREVSKGGEKLLEKSVEQKIRNLLSSFRGKKIIVYGPAYFGKIITHPDHAIVHNAFLSVAYDYRSDNNVQFFIYEDFPYVSKFVEKGKEDFLKYLTSSFPNDYQFSVKERDLSLDKEAIIKKQKAVSAYKSQVTAFRTFGDEIENSDISYNEKRCKKNHAGWYACEVVYEIVKK